MKRIILLFLMLCGVCMGMNNRTIFIKIYDAWKTGNYTVDQIANATDGQVISHAGLDPNEVIQYRKYKNLIKRNAKLKLKAMKKVERRAVIITPNITAIIMALKADGLTTVEAKAELLEFAMEELK